MTEILKARTEPVSTGIATVDHEQPNSLRSDEFLVNGNHYLQQQTEDKSTAGTTTLPHSMSDAQLEFHHNPPKQRKNRPARNSLPQFVTGSSSNADLPLSKKTNKRASVSANNDSTGSIWSSRSHTACQSRAEKHKESKTTQKLSEIISLCTISSSARFRQLSIHDLHTVITLRAHLRDKKITANDIATPTKSVAQILEVLIPKLAAQLSDDELNTPVSSKCILEVAIDCNCTKAIELLVAEGRVKLFKANGEAILTSARSLGNLDIYLALIKHPSAIVTEEDITYLLDDGASEQQIICALKSLTVKSINKPLVDKLTQSQKRNSLTQYLALLSEHPSAISTEDDFVYLIEQGASDEQLVAALNHLTVTSINEGIIDKLHRYKKTDSLITYLTRVSNKKNDISSILVTLKDLAKSESYSDLFVALISQFNLNINFSDVCFLVKSKFPVNNFLPNTQLKFIFPTSTDQIKAEIELLIKNGCTDIELIEIEKFINCYLIKSSTCEAFKISCSETTLQGLIENKNYKLFIFFLEKNRVTLNDKQHLLVKMCLNLLDEYTQVTETLNELEDKVNTLRHKSTKHYQKIYKAFAATEDKDALERDQELLSELAGKIGNYSAVDIPKYQRIRATIRAQFQQIVRIGQIKLTINDINELDQTNLWPYSDELINYLDTQKLTYEEFKASINVKSDSTDTLVFWCSQFKKLNFTPAQIKEFAIEVVGYLRFDVFVILKPLIVTPSRALGDTMKAALARATHENNPSICKLLLATGFISIDNNLLMGLMHVDNNYELVKIALHHLQEPNQLLKTDDKGNSPLKLAFAMEDDDIAKIILKYLIDHNFDLVELKNTLCKYFGITDSDHKKLSYIMVRANLFASTSLLFQNRGSDTSTTQLTTVTTDELTHQCATIGLPEIQHQNAMNSYNEEYVADWAAYSQYAGEYPFIQSSTKRPQSKQELYQAELSRLEKETQVKLARTTSELQKTLDLTGSTTTADKMKKDLESRYDQVFKLGSPSLKNITETLKEVRTQSEKSRQFGKISEQLKTFEAQLNRAKADAQAQISKLNTQLNRAKADAQAQISALEAEIQQLKENNASDKFKAEQFDNVKAQVSQITAKANQLRIKDQQRETELQQTQEQLIQEKAASEKLQTENERLKRELEEFKAAQSTK